MFFKSINQEDMGACQVFMEEQGKITSLNKLHNKNLRLE
jgi:hypothetical protein